MRVCRRDYLSEVDLTLKKVLDLSMLDMKAAEREKNLLKMSEPVIQVLSAYQVS